MRRSIVLVLILFTVGAYSQQKLSLEECYQMVAANYPIAKQKALIQQQLQHDKEALETGKLPQLDFSAQATYQSEVTKVPIPNSTIKPLDKDQYKATLTANELIFGGGSVDAAVKTKEAELKAKQQQVDVSLYQLKKQVNQLYFSVLLLQEKEALLAKKKAQLQEKLKEVRSGVIHGSLLPASDKVLEAELLKIDQQSVEISRNKLSVLATLSSLTGKAIAPGSELTYPLIKIDTTTALSRPELDLFQYKKDQVSAAEKQLSKQNIPKLFGFATGGYGNPGLNMLDNSFQPFYIVGLKLNWNVFDWDANKKKRQSLLLNNALVDNEQEVFELNSNIELDQQLSEIKKLEAILASDQKIVNLRNEVLESAASQLRNGVITSSAYITELTNLYEAESDLSTHNTQLLLAMANYNTIKGN